MTMKLIGLVFGMAIGFVFAWAWLSDPAVIREMLLLRQADVFLLMGSAIAIAAIGMRLLRSFDVRAFATGEPAGWTLERPALRHVGGSLLFGAGWSIAATCPGPIAVMIGEGRFGGLIVAAGLIAGILIQPSLIRTGSATRLTEIPGSAGL